MYIVTNALVLHRDRFMKWPNPAETAESKKNFSLRGGFPGVNGRVDGTHVRIQAPSEDEAVYVNRKGWHSVNVQVICNHEGTIVLISYRHSFSFLIIQKLLHILEFVLYILMFTLVNSSTLMPSCRVGHTTVIYFDRQK